MISLEAMSSSYTDDLDTKFSGHPEYSNLRQQNLVFKMTRLFRF